MHTEKRGNRAGCLQAKALQKEKMHHPEAEGQKSLRFFLCRPDGQDMCRKDGKEEKMNE